MNSIKTASIVGLIFALAPQAFAQAASPTAAPSTTTVAAPPTSPPAPAATVAAVRKLINDFQTRVAAARKSGKFSDFQAAVQQYVEPDCTFDVNASSHSYTEYLEDAKASMKRPLSAATITIKTLFVTTTDAKETGQTDFTSSYVDTNGQLGAKGATHQIETLSAFYFHWFLTNGSWKVHYGSITSGKTLVDGKVYTPPTTKANPRGNSGYGNTPNAAVPTFNPQLPSVLKPTAPKKPRRRKY